MDVSYAAQQAFSKVTVTVYKFCKLSRMTLKSLDHENDFFEGCRQVIDVCLCQHLIHAIVSSVVK